MDLEIKDTLLKDKVPLYSLYKKAAKGEHGLVRREHENGENYVTQFLTSAKSSAESCLKNFYFG